MENFIMIDGKKFRLVPEETQEEPVKNLTGYERAVPGEKYFFADERSDVNEYTDNNTTDDTDIYLAGNYYTDKKLAFDNARADRLMRRLRRYAAMQGGIVTKNNPAKNGRKYYIGFNDTHGLMVDWVEKNWSNAGAIYFVDPIAAQHVLEAFRYELEWYFTKYEPQLI